MCVVPHLEQNIWHGDMLHICLSKYDAYLRSMAKICFNICLKSHDYSLLDLQIRLIDKDCTTKVYIWIINPRTGFDCVVLRPVE